jgi:SAM-dependent methyltransferase
MSGEPNTQAGYRSLFYATYRSGFKGRAEDSGARRLGEVYGSFLESKLDRVLELGAGPGEFVEWLTQRGVSEAWGVDNSAEQVEAARSRGRDVRQADLFEALSSCPDRSLDGLVALDVLEHLTRDQLVVVAREASRVLMPGGLFLVQVPNGHALRVGPVWSSDLTHETLLSDETLAQLFAPVGMKVERVWGVTPGFGKLTRAVRTLAWKMLTLWPRTLDLLEAGRTARVYERVMCALIRKPE